MCASLFQEIIVRRVVKSSLCVGLQILCREWGKSSLIAVGITNWRSGERHRVKNVGAMKKLYANICSKKSVLQKLRNTGSMTLLCDFPLVFFIRQLQSRLQLNLHALSALTNLFSYSKRKHDPRAIHEICAWAWTKGTVRFWDLLLCLEMVLVHHSSRNHPS